LKGKIFRGYPLKKGGGGNGGKGEIIEKGAIFAVPDIPPHNRKNFSQ
jgi:hypothetical protein